MEYMTGDSQGRISKNEPSKLPPVIIPLVFYTLSYIVYIVHKVVNCEMEQIKDRLKPDPEIYFVDA